jgi:hypothetical protein
MDYCLRCKQKTNNDNQSFAKTKNDRIMRKSICSSCGGKKSCFCSIEQLEGDGVSDYLPYAANIAINQVLPTLGAKYAHHLASKKKMTEKDIKRLKAVSKGLQFTQHLGAFKNAPKPPGSSFIENKLQQQLLKNLY